MCAGRVSCEGGSGEGCLSEGQQQEGGGGVEETANREVCVLGG